MRVLISCVPQTGHIVPLLPLAEAFATQGDDVLFATGEDAREPVTARGLAFRAAGPPFGEWYARLLARTRGTPGDGLPPANIERYFLPRLFGEVGAAAMLDDLLATARSFRPDLFVFDPLLFAGPLVAAELDVPQVLHTIGPLTDPGVVELVADVMSPIWRQFGRTVAPDAGLYAGRTLTICPPTLDPPSAALPHAHPLRPTPLPQRAGQPPRDIPEHVWQRPVLYLTLGTFSNANLAMFRTFFEAVADLPLNAVATIGRDNDPHALGAVPPNVHVARFIPQAELLPHCTAVLHHAGAGTTFGLLAHALPSLAVPQSADNFAIAGRLAAAGAATVLMPDEVAVDSVRQAVRAVVDEPRYRTAAVSLADEIAAMPSPEQVARALAG